MEQPPPRVGVGGALGARGVALALFLLCPGTWVVAIVRGEPQRAGAGTRRGAAGVGSAAGEMPEAPNKTRLHLACTSLGAGERGRRGREREARAGSEPPRSGMGLRPRPSASRSLGPLLPAHPAAAAKSELAPLPRLHRTKPSPSPEPALTVSKVTGASSAC